MFLRWPADSGKKDIQDTRCEEDARSESLLATSCHREAKQNLTCTREKRREQFSRCSSLDSCFDHGPENKEADLSTCSSSRHVFARNVALCNAPALRFSNTKRHYVDGPIDINKSVTMLANRPRDGSASASASDGGLPEELRALTT